MTVVPTYSETTTRREPGFADALCSEPLSRCVAASKQACSTLQLAMNCLDPNGLGPHTNAETSEPWDPTRAIAHDVLNLLVGILRNAESLEERESQRGEKRRRIIAAAQRARVLARRLLTPPVGGEHEIDAALMLRRNERELRSVLPAHIALRVDAPPSPARVRASFHELEVILFNLVANAGEAFKDCGGCVRVELRAHPSGAFALEVSDNGPGIPQRALERLCQPGYTTKTGGSGLGMALVKEAVGRLGGALQGESSARETRFVVLLPPACE